MITISKVLDELHLKADMVAAEFGCGNGEFAVQLAHRLKKGKVYALDIQEERISALNGRLQRLHIGNVVAMHCDIEAKNGSTLAEGWLDLVLIPNVLFQSENKLAIIQEAYRILKPGGHILIIDWLKSHTSHVKHLVDPAEVKTIANSMGLTLKKEFAPGDYHYAILFAK